MDEKKAANIPKTGDHAHQKRRNELSGSDSHNATPINQTRRRTLISSVSSASPTVASEFTMDSSAADKHKRHTVGNRLGHKAQLQQDFRQQSQIGEVVPQLEQITKLLKDCVFQQQKGKESVEKNGNRQQQQQLEREKRFEPPWETKIGQLQQVVRALHRHTDHLLENHGSVIVRCYPYKSTTYMHLVYNLIYATLSGSHQFGPLQAPTEIRPILLHYDDNGIPNPIQQQAVPFGIPQFAQQTAWTDFVLIRVRFANHEPALCFLQTFNRTVGRVFDRRQVRAPFAHPDLTQPERVLRYRLQQICMEKNGGRNWPGPQNQNRQRPQYSNTYYRNLCQNGERYFHNGVQIYKEYPNGRTEPLQWEPFSELQYLHVVVASLRKYAPIFKQKEASVIIQNIEQDGNLAQGLNEADTERITAVVYNIVATEAYRKRCQELQERTKARNNSNSTANNNGPQQNPANAYLPARIERICSRKPTATNKAECQSASATNNRPPLVRIQFRNKEAALAFCQLFKDFQLKVREKKSAGTNEKYSNKSAPTDTESEYSDLSDMEVFSEQDGESKKNKHRGKQSIFFPNAFAHRDLTAPELALGYALRQYCREKNGTGDTKESASAAAASSSSTSAVNGRSGKQMRFYNRAGRIFERSAKATGP